jgi:hypothetical protein
LFHREVCNLHYKNAPVGHQILGQSATPNWRRLSGKVKTIPDQYKELG